MLCRHLSSIPYNLGNICVFCLSHWLMRNRMQCVSVWSLRPEGVKLLINNWLIVVSQGQDILPANWEKGGEFFWPISEDTRLESWKHNLLIILEDSCSEIFRHVERFHHKRRLIAYFPNVYYCPLKCDKGLVGTTLCSDVTCVQWSPP